MTIPFDGTNLLAIYADRSLRSTLDGLMDDQSTDQRIILDPAILAGKPVVRGTRLSVEFIIGLLADGWTEADILAEYSGLTIEDIKACLAYARQVLQSEKVFPTAA